MYNKINYTLVGIFVFLFGVGLFAFGFWLSKYDVKDNYKLYKIYFSENVSGLSKDSSVKLRGVDVGKVVSISIDPKNIERVEAIIKIKKDVPIKEDMRAHLEMIGVTGLLSVVIDGGSNNSKDLVAKNGNIPIIQTRPSWIDTTKDSVANVTHNLNKLLLKSQKLLSNENIKNLDKTLANLQELTKNANKLEEKTVESLKKVDKTVENYNKLALLAKEKISLMTNDLHKLSKSLQPTIKSVRRVSNNLNSVVLNVKKGLKRGDYNLRAIFEPLTIDTRLLTNEIGSLVRQITQSPNDIIFKSRKGIKGPGE